MNDTIYIYIYYYRSFICNIYIYINSYIYVIILGKSLFFDIARLRDPETIQKPLSEPLPSRYYVMMMVMMMID